MCTGLSAHQDGPTVTPSELERRGVVPANAGGAHIRHHQNIGGSFSGLSGMRSLRYFPQRRMPCLASIIRSGAHVRVPGSGVSRILLADGEFEEPKLRVRQQRDFRLNTKAAGGFRRHCGDAPPTVPAWDFVNIRYRR